MPNTYGNYDRLADAYERHVGPVYAPMVAGLVARARLGSGMRVLDVAAGTGAAAIPAARRVEPDGCVVALDASRGMLACAAGSEPALRCVQALAVPMPFPDGCFDCVLSSFALGLLPDTVAVLAEIRRVLAPGGWLRGLTFAWTSEGDMWRAALAHVRGLEPVPETDPNETVEAYRRDLNTAGFPDATVECVPHAHLFPDAQAAWGYVRAKGGPFLGSFEELPEPERTRFREQVMRRFAAFRTTGGIRLERIALYLSAPKGAS